MTARITIASLIVRINAQDALIAELRGSAPAKVTAKKATTGKAAKKVAPKATVAKKVAAKVELAPLSSKSRAAFIAAAMAEGVDFNHLSNRVIAEHCVVAGYAPAGFCIGLKYTAMFS